MFVYIDLRQECERLKYWKPSLKLIEKFPIGYKNTNTHTHTEECEQVE